MSTNLPENVIGKDPSVVAIIPSRDELSRTARALVISTPSGFAEAGEWLKKIKTNLAVVEAARTKITSLLNAALKARNAEAKQEAQPLLDAEVAIKAAMKGYHDAQEALRLEQQRKLDEDARRERERLQAIADEAKRKADAEAAEKRRLAAEAEAQGRAAEAAKLAAQAVKIDEKAQAKVEKFEDRASQVVAPIVNTAPPRVAGVSMQEVWDFEVIDENKVPRMYCDVSAKRIRSQVQATKGLTSIAGVRVFKTTRVAAGTN